MHIAVVIHEDGRNPVFCAVNLLPLKSVVDFIDDTLPLNVIGVESRNKKSLTRDNNCNGFSWC